MIYCDFKVGLTQEQSSKRLKIGFRNETPSWASLFRWFQNSTRAVVSFYNEEYRARIAIV